MPTYYKPGQRKGNRTYTVRGRIDGREYEIATPARDKAGAEDHWDEFKRRIRAQRRDAPTRETATFDDAVRLYRANMDLSLHEGKYVKRLEAHFAGRFLSDITLADLHAAAHKLYPGCLPQTKNRACLHPAGSILHYAAKAKLCDWMVIEKFPEVDPERPIIYPDEAAVAIEAAKGDPELHALLLTLVYQGWRIGETLATERARIDFDRKTIMRFVSKSQVWRECDVDPEVCAAWRALPENEDGRLFTYRNRDVAYRAIDRLGLPFHYRPHMSRRGFATALKDMGADVLDIMKAGQWENAQSVLVYIKDDVERTRQTRSLLRGKIRGGREKRKRISA